MPIFEYRCDDCGTSFEKLVRRPADSAALACPSCGKDHLTQQLSTFSAHANGAPARAEAPACPGGMCRTPGICGMN
jgi:putative FmdB family regulatory protein